MRAEDAREAEKRKAVEHALTLWGQRQRDQDQTRDDLVRGALGVGVSKHRIHVLTGIARTTIDRILLKAQPGEGGPGKRQS